MTLPTRDAGFALPAFSLRKPVTVMVGLAALLVLGGLAYLRIPVKLLPEGLTMPFLMLHINYWNATPREVEEQIAKPVEEVLGTVHNVARMVSKSHPSYARFFMEFKDGTDMDLTYNQVRDRMDRVRSRLPDDIGQIFMWKWNPAAEPILVAHLGDGNVHYAVWLSKEDPALKDAVTEAVEDEVLRLGGSFSAEHGIGQGKLSSMARRKDKVAIATMRAIKQALDPRGIMNPGKVLPPA